MKSANASASAKVNAFGWGLVVVQFAMIFLLIWKAWTAPPAGMLTTVLACTLALAGACLSASTLAFNRLGNWRIHPEIKDGARLITNGPYRWIRHPMYLGVVLVALAVVVWAPGIVTCLITLILVSVLVGKITIEERSMQRRFGQQFENYISQTTRLFPGLW